MCKRWNMLFVLCMLFQMCHYVCSPNTNKLDRTFCSLIVRECGLWDSQPSTQVHCICTSRPVPSCSSWQSHDLHDATWWRLKRTFQHSAQAVRHMFVLLPYTKRGPYNNCTVNTFQCRIVVPKIRCLQVGTSYSLMAAGGQLTDSLQIRVV